MKFIALDASTKSTGFAVYEDTKLLDYGCFQNSSTDLFKRIHFMVDKIADVIEQYGIELVVLEEVRPEEKGSEHANNKTYKALTYLQGYILGMLHDKFPKVKNKFYYPNEWRAECGIHTGRGIKRDVLKKAGLDFVKQKFNVAASNDDIADAIGIGYAESRNYDFLF